MHSKKSPKLTKEDTVRQEAIRRKTKEENVKLDHPKGKERFISVLRKSVKK